MRVIFITLYNYINNHSVVVEKLNNAILVITDVFYQSLLYNMYCNIIKWSMYGINVLEMT